MANRTLVMGSQANCPTTTGAASTFDKATLVRLCNNGSTARLVTVVAAQNGTVIGTFTMPANTVEYLEKKSTECIFAANAEVKGTKVGHTN